MLYTCQKKQNIPTLKYIQVPKSCMYLMLYLMYKNLLYINSYYEPRTFLQVVFYK